MFQTDITFMKTFIELIENNEVTTIENYLLTRTSHPITQFLIKAAKRSQSTK